MELVHQFTVPVPADKAWDLLLDVEKVVTCLPGAVVTSVDGDAFEGGMKIKLGPIGMTFKGNGSFIEKDQAAHRVVMEAKGKDAKGNGGAQATVTATLAEQNGSTTVNVLTDMNVTGKAAQFGTGVMKDVSNRMLEQFAKNLEQLIAHDEPGAAAVAAPAGINGSARTATQNGATAPKPPFVPPNDGGLDVMSLISGSETAQRTAKTVGALLLGLAMGYLFGKNRTLERQLRRG